MNWVGFDVHQSYCEAFVRDDDGTRSYFDRVDSEREKLVKFFEKLGPETSVAMEATGCWGWIYDTIRPLVRRVALLHPLKTHLIAKQRIKTDRRDAKALCELLRGGWEVEAYAAPPELRDLRQLLRGRVVVSRQAAAMKNRLRSILRMHGVKPPKKSSVFGASRSLFWRSVALPEGTRLVVDRYLEHFELAHKHRKELEAEIVARAKASAPCTLLMTIPGIGFFTALLLVGEVGDFSRFRHGGLLASWAGLVPSLYSSGGKAHRGPLTRQGNRWVRWALMEGVSGAVRSCRRFANLHRRVRARKGRAPARAAVAREILVVALAVMRTGEVFDPERGRHFQRRARAAACAPASCAPASAAAPAPQPSVCPSCAANRTKVSA